MKTKILAPQEIEVTHIALALAVRYDEEEIPNDFPGRKGDLWSAVIDIDTGKIESWNGGKRRMHLTVKDCGSYTLLCRGKIVKELQNDYVPHGVIPGHYGDVVLLNIEEDGTISNWPQTLELSDFFTEEED